MSKTILLADDSATIRKIVELTFGDTDYHVESVANGDEALEKLHTFSPDLILADVVMPGASGYEICRQVKRSARPIPVLLLAGTFETFDHEEARACGADGCLMKPFESRTLLDRVGGLLADREALGGEAVAPLEAEPVAAAAPGEPASPQADSGPPTAAAPQAVSEAETELPPGFDDAALDALARALLRRLSTDVLREIAREVVPQVAERVVKERIREIEGEQS